MTFSKHKHGTPNPVIVKEEDLIIAKVQRALSSTSNSQIIGRNGEIPLRDFFARYLPNVLRVGSGHFVSPNGILSPEIDIMILDSRYPLLAENEDGSVLAMLHSVIATIEVKTNLKSNDIKKMWQDSERLSRLASEIPEFYIDIYGFAYKCGSRLSTIESKYVSEAKPGVTSLDIYLLRLHPNDQCKQNVGIELHFEPVDDLESEDVIEGHLSIPCASHSPLSDLYYRLVQNSYFTLGSRMINFSMLGNHMNNYLKWSTCSWEDFYKSL